jgi:methyl-accepting chemotaxis protein
VKRGLRIRGLQFGILPKLLITMMVVMFVPLATIWLLDYRTSVDHLSLNIEERLSAQADGAVGYVNSWVDTNLRMLRQNARLEDIVSMDPHRQALVLQSIIREYPYVFLAHTVGLDGMNVARSDQEAPKNYGDREYVNRVIAGAPMGRQFVISKTTGKPSFILSVPITREGRIVGVLGIAMDVNDLTRRITAVHIGDTGFTFLVDDTGNVVAHPRARQNLAKHPAVTGSGYEAGAKKRSVFVEDGKQIIAYSEKTEQGWTLVAQQDYAEAYEPLRAANRNALALLVGSVLFVGVVSSVLTPRLTRPIRNLTEIAEQISRGQLATTIEEVERTDEIGGLARAIDRLKTSVEVAMKRLGGESSTAHDYSPTANGGVPIVIGARGRGDGR